MQECGPRFTLKLKSLQHGTFDTKGGEYEWVHKVLYLLTSIAVLNISCPAKHFSYILLAWLSLYFLSSFPFSRKWTQVEEGFSCDLVLELSILDCISAGIWLIWWMLVILKFLESFKIFLYNFLYFYLLWSCSPTIFVHNPDQFWPQIYVCWEKNLHFAYRLYNFNLRWYASTIEISKFNISFVHWCCCYSFVTSLGVIEWIVFTWAKMYCPCIIVYMKSLQFTIGWNLFIRFLLF